MKNRYQNLWANLLNVKKPDFYENNAREIGSHRGVVVYKLFDHGYDFVIGDACITQRAGCTEMVQVIDDILDGRSPVSDVVAMHLRKLGFAPLTYSDAMEIEKLQEIS